MITLQKAQNLKHNFFPPPLILADSFMCRCRVQIRENGKMFNCGYPLGTIRSSLHKQDRALNLKLLFRIENINCIDGNVEIVYVINLPLKVDLSSLPFHKTVRPD